MFFTQQVERLGQWTESKTEVLPCTSSTYQKLSVSMKKRHNTSEPFSSVYTERDNPMDGSQVLKIQ